MNEYGADEKIGMQIEYIKSGVPYRWNVYSYTSGKLVEVKRYKDEGLTNLAFADSYDADEDRVAEDGLNSYGEIIFLQHDCTMKMGTWLACRVMIMSMLIHLSTIRMRKK